MKQRKPNRLKNYDYSRPGYYFVTICTHNKMHYFGNIIAYKMVLNQLGEYANRFWLEIPKHFPIAELDEYVIMPNHIHGIIIIHDVGNADMRSMNNKGKANMHKRKANMHSLQYDRTKMLLSKIIQQYKAAVTRQNNKLVFCPNFKWQKSFYDHIIRNDVSLFRIRKYIWNNPLKWEYDQENLNQISLQEKKLFWKKFLKEF